MPLPGWSLARSKKWVRYRSQPARFRTSGAVEPEKVAARVVGQEGVAEGSGSVVGEGDMER